MVSLLLAADADIKENGIMNAFWNLGSVVFGLIAWGLPVFSLMLDNKQKRKHWSALCAVSISACSLAMKLQLNEVKYRVGIGDWSALEDTSGAVAAVSSILFTVTIVLNAIVFFVYYEANRKKD
jgi:cytochrome c oxidase subunit 4